MSSPFAMLAAIDEDTQLANVVIDTPKGSHNKYKLGSDGLWRLGKVLPQGMCFPYDFGFVPQTKGEDGDAIDVLLMMDAAAFPGCVVSARLLGVLKAEQTEDGETVRNDRLMAVVETPFNRPRYRSIDEVDTQQLDEIEQFFVAYNKSEGREFKPLARKGPESAMELLKAAFKS